MLSNKTLFIIILSVLLLFYFYIYYNFILKEPFFQLHNTQNIIINQIAPSNLCLFDINKYIDKLKIINRNKNIFSINNEGNIIINHPGQYKINFSLGASKRLNLQGLPQENIYNEDTYFVDSFIEWYLGNIVKIPIITENRIDGPENLANFSRILTVEKIPYKLPLKYKNLDFNIVNNFVIENLVFSLEKKK